MFVLKSQEQRLSAFFRRGYLPILVESFLIDRKSQGLSPDAVEHYTQKLQTS